MNEPTYPNFRSLPEWARGAVEAATKQVSERSVLEHLDAPAWPLLVEAAVVGAFLPRELHPTSVDNEVRQQAEQVVLGFSELAHGSGAVKWSLTQRTRAKVVQAALERGDLLQAIERTSGEFADSASRALRDSLTGAAARNPPSDLASLEATRVAVASLAGVTGVLLPALEDLEREVELRRLLAEFDRMIGRRPEGTEREKSHRFYGREREIERLRSHVGVIPADTIRSLINRVYRQVAQKLTGWRRPLSVWGIGGVGKTTLIAKFMLEHAEAGLTRYPFAYLDFDRSTLSARHRSGLFMEICLQIGAQFKELATPMASLRDRTAKLAFGLETGREYESMSYLAPLMLELRNHVDEHLSAAESTMEWARPFLLVFDTFEVVQYSKDDVAGLEYFIRGFSPKSEVGLWPRMRLVISGRRRVNSFLGEVEELPLGALDAAGSVDLILALAGDAGKPITRPEAKALVAAVARAAGEDDGGVQPLRLRLIGEVFLKMDGEGSSIARSLTLEFEQPLDANGHAAAELIEGILVRRVLDHVADPRVRALTDPGLVVRRITPDVIRAVMTLGTAKPGSGEPAGADTEPAEPWIVDRDEADSIFLAFGREVSLVVPHDHELWHRPDVRQQMLPLIRARRPNRFRALNRLAFDYFRALADADKEDLRAAAEAVYHGLWLEEPLDELNRLWRTKPAFDPKIDPNEFDPGSQANVFVRAKARETLSSTEVRKLPREVALDWLDARSADMLLDRRIEDAIEAIRAAAGDQYELLDERAGTAAVLARLLFRAGLWDDAAQLALRHVSPANADDLLGSERRPQGSRGDADADWRLPLVSIFRTWATIVGKTGEPHRSLYDIGRIMPTVRDPLAHVEVAAHAIVGFALRGESWGGSVVDLGFGLREAAAAVGRRQWKQEPRILRLAILTCDSRVNELISYWAESRERLPRGIDVAAAGALLARLLGETSASDAPDETFLLSLGSLHRERALSVLDEVWQRKRKTVLEAIRAHDEFDAGFRQLVAYDHIDWIQPLGNALTRTLKRGDSKDQMALLQSMDFLPRGFSRARRDGIAIVQAATDAGRLLELATLLGRLHEEPRNDDRIVGEMFRDLPHDASGIARALLEWHAAILRVLPPTKEGLSR